VIAWRVPDGWTRLVLIRHAEPDAAMRGRCYGQLDVGLSPAGHAQAAQLARALAGAPIEAIYSSPRRRALDTARPLGRPPERVDALREIDFGELEGMTYDAAAARYPELYQRWMARPTEVAFPGGEHYRDVRARVCAAAARIRARHAGGCAAVFAHGGTVRTLVAEALRLADADLFRIDIGHASVSVIDWFADGTPVVRLVNGQPAAQLAPDAAAHPDPG
jgi:alpha-ribazole phosphatase